MTTLLTSICGGTSFSRCNRALTDCGCAVWTPLLVESCSPFPGLELVREVPSERWVGHLWPIAVLLQAALCSVPELPLRPTRCSGRADIPSEQRMSPLGQRWGSFRRSVHSVKGRSARLPFELGTCQSVSLAMAESFPWPMSGSFSQRQFELTAPGIKLSCLLRSGPNLG